MATDGGQGYEKMTGMFNTLRSIFKHCPRRSNELEKEIERVRATFRDGRYHVSEEVVQS